MRCCRRLPAQKPYFGVSSTPTILFSLEFDRGEEFAPCVEPVPPESERELVGEDSKTSVEPPDPETEPEEEPVVGGGAPWEIAGPENGSGTPAPGRTSMGGGMRVVEDPPPEVLVEVVEDPFPIVFVEVAAIARADELPGAWTIV